MAVLTAPEPVAARSLRVVRIGLLGLGNVGQAVARMAASAAPALREQGIALSIECALVQDIAKPRRGPKPARVTSNAEAFLRGRYDVVIDVLPSREPAATIVGRVLGKGTPVVSGNKILVAAEGRRLRRIAARAGTTLRVEAAVIAGVPFIGAFERRPLAADVTRFAGIVNGTSHFILTKIEEGVPFDAAVREAQRLGYAEPDPEADVAGRDALGKLTILTETLLGVAIRPASVSVEGIEALTPADLAAARRLGGAIKPVIFAERAGDLVNAFVGPAFVPASHPLAGITGRDNAIAIDTCHNGRLLFAGPGAGPDVTAATLLDDAIEAAAGPSAHPFALRSRPAPLVTVRAPETPRFRQWPVLDV